MARTRWVTFDCYGTLVDWQSGFASILASMAGDRVQDLVHAYHPCARRFEREQPHKPYKQVLRAGLTAAAADAGVSLPDSAARVVAQSWNRLRPFADTELLLAELRRRGWLLAVLTNCDDDLFEVTHRTFRRPFDLFVTGERIRGFKPAPWHFRAFELLTRVDRRNWVHVASSWDDDIRPAQAFGVRQVWLDREGGGESSPGAPRRVRSGREAVEAIEAAY